MHVPMYEDPKLTKLERIRPLGVPKLRTRRRSDGSEAVCESTGMRTYSSSHNKVTSLMKNRAPLGPYSRNTPRALHV